MGPAQIFRRTGVLARDADRQRLIIDRPSRWRRLDYDPMLPAVSHVVTIFECTAGTQLRHDSGDRDPALVAIVAGIYIQADFMYSPVRRHHACPDLEFVRVRICPPHDPLQIVMQARQRPLIGNQHSPPDERRNVLQFDAQRDGLRPWGCRQP